MHFPSPVVPGGIEPPTLRISGRSLYLLNYGTPKATGKPLTCRFAGVPAEITDAMAVRLPPRSGSWNAAVGCCRK